MAQVKSTFVALLLCFGYFPLLRFDLWHVLPALSGDWAACFGSGRTVVEYAAPKLKCFEFNLPSFTAATPSGMGFMTFGSLIVVQCASKERYVLHT